MTLRFGTDGVRGVANRDLTPELVTALGRAAARVLGADRPFVVGRDTRRSGPLLEAALVAGLCSEGADVERARRSAHPRRRVPRPVVRRAGGGALRQPQPVPRQRREALRTRRPQDRRRARGADRDRAAPARRRRRRRRSRRARSGRRARPPRRGRRLHRPPLGRAGRPPARRAVGRGRLRQRRRLRGRAVGPACARRLGRACSTTSPTAPTSTPAVARPTPPSSSRPSWLRAPMRAWRSTATPTV